MNFPAQHEPNSQPTMNENAPGLCPFCGHAPASSDQSAMNENIPGPLWKRVLNFIFRSEDFDIFIWHSIVISILYAAFFIHLGQYHGTLRVLMVSLPVSAYSFLFFIIFRTAVKFARIKLDSISSKQQSTTTQGEYHG